MSEKKVFIGDIIDGICVTCKNLRIEDFYTHKVWSCDYKGMPTLFSVDDDDYLTCTFYEEKKGSKQ